MLTDSALNSSALFLTIVTVLYALWYPEYSEKTRALRRAETNPNQPKVIAERRSAVARDRKNRWIPLFLLTLIFDFLSSGILFRILGQSSPALPWSSDFSLSDSVFVLFFLSFLFLTGILFAQVVNGLARPEKPTSCH